MKQAITFFVFRIATKLGLPGLLLGLVIVGAGCASMKQVAELEQGTGLVLYVSSEGDDSWTGRSPKADSRTLAGPFATLERARDEIRQIKKTGALPEGGVTVAILPGRYERAEALELGTGDGGTATSPIVYRGWPGKKVTICGSRTVEAWQPVTDPAVLKRLDPKARAQVFQADLKALGVTEYGDLLHDAEWEVQYRHHKDDNQGEATQGDAIAAQRFVARTGKTIQSRLELFCDGRPMRISRWPNQGFTHVKKALGKTKFDVRGLPGRREGVFSCADDRPSRWVDEKNAMVRGYWYRDWVVQSQKIESIDPVKNIITLAKPYHTYGGYRDGMWFFGFNLLCELDEPGEWYIDREAGVLYFWPPKPLAQSRVEVSVANGLFRLSDTAHVTVRGMSLEAGRGTAVRIKDSENCRVVACSIRNMTNYGVTIVDGENCAVVGCDITATGGGGVFMAGGDRQKLGSGGHSVENCHIHHFARWDRTYRPGILMTGSGLRAAHNLIHHAPHSAIVYGGPLHRFEYNEIHNVCEESHDCGAIYGGRSWCMRGDLFLHNYLHHICGKDGGACNGIYLDDANSGTTIRGNVFHQVLRPVFVGGGRDTLVENNLFVDCPQAFHMDARYAPGNWAARYGEPRIAIARKKGILPPNIRFQEPPYSTRFPKLARMLDDDPTWPKGNILRGNVFWRGNGENLRRTGWENPVDSGRYRNAWWHHIQQSVYDLLTIENNMVDVDPGFVDEAAGDFRLRADSPSRTIGFKPIPFAKIGLYRDGNRASWPVEHEVTPLPPAKRKLVKTTMKKPKRKTLRKEPAPVFSVVRAGSPIVIDGKLTSEEWRGCDPKKALPVNKSLYHEAVKFPSWAWIARDGENLYIAVRNQVDPSKPLTVGKRWARNDAVEISLRNPRAGKNAPIVVLRGYPDGKFESSAEAGAPAEVVAKAGKAVSFDAKVEDKGQWSVEYRIPLNLFAVQGAPGAVLECNISVRKIAGPDDWAMWQGTGGLTWEAGKAGVLKLEK